MEIEDNKTKKEEKNFGVGLVGDGFGLVGDGIGQMADFSKQGLSKFGELGKKGIE